MVNAILRKFAANREDMPPLPKGSPAQTLSLRYSHPRWLVERLLSLIGEEETEAYLRMNNQVVPTTIQTNPLKGTPEELEKLLRQTGAQVEPHPWLTGCFSVSGTGDLEQLSAFREGRFTVQDAAARLVATVAAPAPEDRVLDVCAAPGGKSFAMAMDRRDRGQILSCDVHPHKLKLIDSGAQRLGITSIRTALADAREEHAAWLEQADVVVADVPCSGLGIIRKKPDIRYKNPRDLAQLPAIQGDILENACRYVCPGGVLVYSTCTVLPEENQEIIHVFLSRHPEFRRETFTLPGPVGLCDGEATLWPQRLGTDGFLHLPNAEESMTDIKSMTMEELTHTLREMGQPAFRGGQVFTWLHRGVTSFEEMSDLPRTLREQLAQTFHITAPTVARKQESRLDGTVKYLWELADGNCIETVLMQYHHGNTVCISSQVGCRMGCAFCASTIAGKVRDLTPLGDAGSGAVHPAGFRPGDLQYRADGHWRASGQHGYRAAVSDAGEPPQGAEHRDAAHQPVHLRRDTGHPASGGASAPADAPVSLHAPDSETRSASCP